MWPVWYYLSGVVPLANARMSLEEFNASAKVARKAPFDRNVEKTIGFQGFSKCARTENLEIPDKNVLFSYVLLKFDVGLVE